MAHGGLPVSKLVPSPLSVDFDPERHYQPAPLDLVSLVNGLNKYDHEQVNFSDQFKDTFMAVLEVVYGPYLEDLRQWTNERIFQEFTTDSASGFPFNRIGKSLKKDVIRDVSDIEPLLVQFETETTFFNASLKDELRPSNKDARVFVYQSLPGVIMGMKLFGAQNEALNFAYQRTPYSVGFQHPGTHLLKVWGEVGKRLYRNAADGISFDANIQLQVVEIVRDFRKKYLPVSLHSLVDRYYDSTYNPWVICMGQILSLTGQTSGQFNTTSDNTLISSGYAYTYCVSNQIPLSRTSIYSCGDDLLFASDHPVCWSLMGRWYSDHGMYLEFASEFNCEVEDLTFLGTRAQPGELAYTAVESKLLPGLNWSEKGMTSYDFGSKLLSYCQLLAFSPYFERVRSVSLKYITDNNLLILKPHFNVDRLRRGYFRFESLYDGV